MKCTPSGTCGATSRTTAPLTEPTSERIAPGASAGPIASAIAAEGADRRAQNDEIGPGDSLGRIGVDCVAELQPLGGLPRRLGLAPRR